jgi:5-methylthioadenosine/S-adenosylhomocysteine deaminase
MTHLSATDIQLIAEHRVNVIHCPESNLKLASGFCPVNELITSNINIAIGTDGSASNNDIDMLGETKTAALLTKGRTKQADALPAKTALRMATINGAKALRLDKKIGSLEIGKQADMFAINLNSIETQPIYDVISTLIYSANRSQITDVWVAGQRLMQDQQLTTLDEAQLIEKVKHWQRKINPFHHQPNKAV